MHRSQLLSRSFRAAPLRASMNLARTIIDHSIRESSTFFGHVMSYFVMGWRGPSRRMVTDRSIIILHFSRRWPSSNLLARAQVKCCSFEANKFRPALRRYWAWTVDRNDGTVDNSSFSSSEPFLVETVSPGHSPSKLQAVGSQRPTF